MINDASKEKILEALLSFDNNLRGTDKWEKWDSNKSHKYAISYNGLLYPVKQIISNATGTSRDSFNGGNEANSFMEKKGFTIIELPATSMNDQSDIDLKQRKNEKKENREKGKKLSQNMILYGPPGTGKTYSVVDLALEIIDGQGYQELLYNPDQRKEAMVEFKKLVTNGRIAFCTFHQSYGYEEFIEGLRSDGKGGFTPTDGIFKIMCDAAKTNMADRSSTYVFDKNKINFHKMSLGDTLDNDENVIYDYCLENNVVSLGWGGDVDYTDCLKKEDIEIKHKENNPKSSSFGADAVFRFKNKIKVGDIVVISEGNYKVRSIAKVTSEYFYNKDTEIRYRHFRSVEWIYKDVPIPIGQILLEKVLSQQAIYTFNKNDINFENLSNLISVSEDENIEKNYVLVIDEINRGNISKIFGELITLIESDKRAGAMNELNATLPYSGDKFTVPQNLFIIGTMNTADRSIALLDTALRRRFHFRELMPRYDVLPETVDGIQVRELLRVMNDRIEYLFDRDHMIGHAYFIGLEAAGAVIEVIRNKVIPLLQEYFYEDWEKIALILGGAGKTGGTDTDSFFISKAVIDPEDLFGDVDEMLNMGEKIRYELVLQPNVKAVLRIYNRIGQ